MRTLRYFSRPRLAVSTLGLPYGHSESSLLSPVRFVHRAPRRSAGGLGRTAKVLQTLRALGLGLSWCLAWALCSGWV